jgi:hypothetical protein
MMIYYKLHEEVICDMVGDEIIIARPSKGFVAKGNVHIFNVIKHLSKGISEIELLSLVQQDYSFDLSEEIKKKVPDILTWLKYNEIVYVSGREKNETYMANYNN